MDPLTMAALGGMGGGGGGMPSSIQAGSEAHSKTGSVTVAGLSVNRAQGLPAWALVLLVLLILAAAVLWFWLRG